MKIGLLNELLADIVCRPSMVCEKSGNPAKDEVFFIKWNVVRNMSAQLQFDFPEECFVDRVVVTLGEKTSLTSLSIKDEVHTLYTHSAETGKTISERTVILEAGSKCNSITLMAESDFSDVEILSVKFYGGLFEEKDIFPTPDTIDFSGKMVPADVFDSYSSDSGDGKRAGIILAEKFFEITGIEMCEKNEAAVRFVTDSSVKKEGFSLEINDGGAVIFASDLRGFVMGAETFIKLCERKGVHAAKVEDAPAYPFRGVHLFLPSERQMDFAKRLIKYVVSPMGYNSVIIEIAGGMRFDSHPEINEAVIYANKMNDEGKWPAFPHSGVAERGCISKESASDFADYIRSFGIDVVPEVQSLGHVQYLTLAHPEIAENDENAEELTADTVTADARPNLFYKHCYCPSNPKSYEILFDIIDEIVEVFKPSEYVHMGHDEVYQVGVCPVCKGKNAAQLYADDVNKIYNYLRCKGLKMIIWSDMLQPVSEYTKATSPAMDMIPKDILMLDFIWYFHLDKDIEDNLIEKGFSVAVGNLYSSHYPRFNTRMRKKGMLGGQISAWVATSEECMQREGKMYDYLLTAQMLWSDAYSKEYTLCYDRMIKGFMPYMRQNIKGIKYPSLEEGAKFETLALSDISFPPQSVEGKNSEINVDGEYRSLIFHHTELKKRIRLPWQEHDVTGKYVLTFSDGTSEEIEITNNGNIGYWNRRQNEAITNPMYRHTAYTSTYFSDSDELKTSDGQNVCIYKYEYILPEGKKLKKVELIQNKKFDTAIFLVKLEGVNT